MRSDQHIWSELVRGYASSSLTVNILCLLHITLDYNFRPLLLLYLKTCLVERKKDLKAFFQLRGRQRDEVHRKVNFIFAVKPYVLLTEWFDPLRALRRHGINVCMLGTNVRVEQQC